MGTFLKRYRWKELGLFIIPFMILLLAMIQLPMSQYYESQIRLNKTQIPFSTALLPSVQTLIPILGLIAVLLLANIIISVFFPKADQLLLSLVGLMSGIGVLMATRLQIVPAVADPNLGERQLGWVLIGLITCIIVLAVLRNMNWLRRYKYTWAALGIFLVGLALINALHVKNFNSPNHDQLNFGPLNLQPSELLKICIAVFFAAYLSENIDIVQEGSFQLGPLRLPPLRQLGPIVLMLLISLALFLFIRELGLALLIYGIFLSTLYLGSGKVSYVIVSLLVFLALGLIAYKLFGYVRDRFQAVTIDPVNWQNWSQTTIDLARNQALQVEQGLVALSSGGILGTGIGLGHTGAFVPVVQSDMIFTALGEELGLAGLFAILGIYLLILHRGFHIAVESTDKFNQLLAASLTSIFGIQALVIMLGNMKFLPLTGIPLPFLSYGGSSIIANYIIVGILLRISHNTAMERDGMMS